MGLKRLAGLAAVGCMFVLAGCGGDVSVATSAGGSGGQAGAASTTGSGAASSTGGTMATTGGAGGTGGTPITGGAAGCPVPLIEVPCVSKVYQCGDTIDNDGDGRVDSQDPDCMGACDNTEDAYYFGMPGRVGPACIVDCYWDSSYGSADDECYWTHKCDPNEAIAPGHPEPSSKCPYDENAEVPGTAAGCADLQATQTPTCAAFCGPLVPNGCDCFGCCELPAGSGKFVWFGSEDDATGIFTCTADTVDDPDKCEPCTPVPSCYNACEPCELCVGKTELPLGCAEADGSPSQLCPEGIQRCGLDCQDACPAGTYCVTGCCQPTPAP